MKVKLKLLSNTAKIPNYATKESACFDICSDEKESIWLYPGKMSFVSTGLSFEIPKGYALILYGRSGLGSKGIRLSNCTGVVDSDYRGEVKGMLYNDSENAICIEPGDRIMQGMIIGTSNVEFLLTEELSESERGLGGFGSTGN